MANNAAQAKATQEFVPIKEVRNGIVILKDGSLRALLLASSINLALKAQDEQEAIIALDSLVSCKERKFPDSEEHYAQAEQGISVLEWVGELSGSLS